MDSRTQGANDTYRSTTIEVLELGQSLVERRPSCGRDIRGVGIESLVAPRRWRLHLGHAHHILVLAGVRLTRIEPVLPVVAMGRHSM